MRKALLLIALMVGVCYVSSCNTSEEMDGDIENETTDPADTVQPSLLPFYETSLGLMNEDVDLDSIKLFFRHFVIYAYDNGLVHDSLFSPIWNNAKKASHDRFKITVDCDTTPDGYGMFGVIIEF